MVEFLLYQGKTAVILAVFYMFYRLLLSRDTFHRFNRIVLLGTAALSFILPLCVITIHKVVTLPSVPSAASDAFMPAAELTEPVWPVVLCAVFAVGALSVLAMSAISAIKVAGIIRRGERRTLEGGEVLVITDADTVPFSWMKYIVLSREDYDNASPQILIHEKAHIALRHSWDIIFVDVITAFQWFNPTMWMLKADLRAIHEFEADDAVLRSGANIKEYQYLLIRKAVSKSGYSVANSFNHSTLKQRITMMLNKKSSRMSAWKALYIIPLVGISLAATAETKVDYRYQEPVAQVDTTGFEIIQIRSYNKETGEEIVKKNVSIRHHDLNQEQKKPLVVLDGVPMGKDFKIESIDPQNIRSITVLKDDSAKEKYGDAAADGVIEVSTKNAASPVISASGELNYTNRTEGDTIARRSVSIRYRSLNDEEGKPAAPLYVIDGKLKGKDFDLGTIDPQNIDSMEILKEDKAVELYGPDAKDGVLVIKTKSQK